MRRDFVVPFAMKSLSQELNLRHLRVWNLYAGGVGSVVDLGMDVQPFLGLRSSNEVDVHLQAGERLPSHVLADKREQTVFDLVPLALTGWKVAARDDVPRL